MNTKQVFVYGFLAVVLVLALTACENPTNPSTPILTGITIAYNGMVVSQSTQLDNLKANLTVIAQYSNNTSKTLASTDYSLVGTLAVGTSTIIVIYEGKTATFTVTVTAPPLSGTINISPSTGVTINTELTATYNGSETGITYQWKKDGTDVGTNSNKYKPTAAGSYTVTVSAAGYQSKTSAAVDVSNPSFSTLSGNVTISPASAVTGTELTANYTGSETVSYQWKKDGGNVGTNSNKYTPTTAGSYAVTVSATGYNPKTSAAVNVSNPSIPNLSGNITISPASAVTGTELTANYTGSETVSYQWKKDGTNVGTNSNKYKPTAAGSYTITVSATGYQSKTSAAVDVNNPSLSTLSGNVTISPASAVTGMELTANYTGSETVSYQWKKDGTNVGTNNKYTPTTAGSYAVTVSATGYNPKTSAAVEVSNPTLTNITLNTDLVKKAYNQNEQLDLFGLDVTASYSDGSSMAITDYTSSPANFEVLSTHGEITVTISYTEENITETASFIVMVSAVTPTKTLTGITLNTTSAQKDYIQNEQLDLSGLVVTAAYSDGSSMAVTDYTSSPANGAALSTTGTITVTVSYIEGNITETASFIVNVTAVPSKTLTGITLNSVSVKKAYNQNEQLDLSGLDITASYSDGSSVAVTDYTSSPANGATLSTTGTITVTVSYIEGNITETASFIVNVTATPSKTLTGITLNSVSVKKAYNQNEQLDLFGLDVTASYSDSSSMAVTDYTSSPANGATLSTTGMITVTVSYTEENITETASFIVNVTAVPSKTLTGITLNTTSVQKDYIQNEQLDLSGLIVTTNYSDGSSVAVTDYTSSPANGATLSTTGTITVTVSYTEENITETASFIVNVTAVPSKTLTGITLNTTSVQKDYIQNEQLDLSGLIVTANYSDSSSAAVTNYTSSPTSGVALSTTGTITVTVSYTEENITETVTFTVTVSKTLTSIILNTDSVKKAYNQNEQLDLSGLDVTANYSDGSSAAVTNYTSSPANGTTLTTTGTIIVTVSYTEESITRTVTFTVTVTAPKTLTDITLNTTSAKKSYNQNEQLDLSGLIVTVNYSDNSNVAVTNYTSSPANGTALPTTGTTTVTVSYTEGTVTRTATFTVTVSKALTGITLNTDSVKKDYYQGEWLDLSGLVVTAAYSDGSSVVVTGYTSPGNGATLNTGTTTITVGYTEGGITRTANFTVTVTRELVFQLITSGDNANTYRVRKGTITSDAVIIPAIYNGLPVTEIGSVADTVRAGAFTSTNITSIAIPASVTTIGTIAFLDCTDLTSVTFAEGSQLTIGNSAFSGCRSLTSITIPASVTTIGSNAFERCPSLTSVIFVEGSQLTTIGSSAFSGCRITSITIPASVTSIGSGAFYGCTSLTSITIPNSVTTIGSSAFENCTSLTSIAIPASVTSIGSGAFYGCTGLTGITVDGNNPNYSSEDGILYNNTKTILIQAPAAGISGNITIPASVTSIGIGAFYGCTGLTGITITPNATTIGSNAFSGCVSLRNIIIDNDKAINNSSFSTSNNWLTIFPATNLSVTFKKNIGNYAFGSNNSDNRLTSVTISEGVTSIGDDAFWNCTGLTSITIPPSVTTIGDSAFSSCTSLTSITIPDGVTSIGASVFSGCTSLTGITIPNSVTSIGDRAFYYCTNLTGITIPAGVTTIGSFAFYYCTSLTSVTIPAGVTTIGSSTFNVCTSLTSITIPASVTSIGGSALAGCTSLTSIAIPASVTTLDAYVFWGWTNTQTIYVPWSSGKKPSGWNSDWYYQCNAKIVYQGQ